MKSAGERAKGGGRRKSETIFPSFSPLFQFFLSRGRFVFFVFYYSIYFCDRFAFTFTLERYNLGVRILLEKLVCLALLRKKREKISGKRGIQRNTLKPLGSYCYSCPPSPPPSPSRRCILEEFVAGINVGCIG